MNETMGAARNAYESAQNGAERVVDSTRQAAVAAKASAGSALSSAIALAVGGAKAVTGLTALLRAFGVDDALGWVGLRRRRDPLAAAAIFGAGFAAGAGVGVLFAPSSGVELRRAIVRGFQGLKGETREALEREEREELGRAENEGMRTVEERVSTPRHHVS